MVCRQRLWRWVAARSARIRIMRRPGGTFAVAAILICLLQVLAACSVGSAGPPESGPTVAAELSSAGDPIPTATKTKEIGPRGGKIRTAAVEVDLPQGAVPTGEKFTVSVGDPGGRVEGEPSPELIFGAPVGVEHAVDIAEPIRVSWDISHLNDEQRAAVVVVRWDADLGVWRPAGQTAVLDGTVLEAEITEFSWVNWVSAGAAAITQSVGELMGQRSGAPTCSDSPPPGWVRNVVRPDADEPAMPLRTCVEPDKDDVLTVRAVNNRPYTQALELVEGQRYAWTWSGDTDFTVAGVIRDYANQALSGETVLIMSPTKATAVGLARPSAPGEVQLKMVAGPTVATVTEDILLATLGSVLPLDNIGGFDSEALNAFVQTVYDCGGKELLKSRDIVGPGTFGRVLSTVQSCAQSDTVALALERLTRNQIAKGGDTAIRAIKTHRTLMSGLGKLQYLQVATFSSYSAELASSGAIGEVALTVYGRGLPPTLGAWSATCSDAAEDSNRLYQNLALQDAFADKSKEFWQFPSWQGSSVTAVQPLKRCGPLHLEAVASEVEADWGDAKAAAVVARSIRAMAPAEDTCTLNDDMLRPVRATLGGWGLDTLAVQKCVDGWAVLEFQESLGDNSFMLRRVDGIWTFYTGFPSSFSRSDFTADGGPSEFASMFAPR